ncbi:hypothetical protein [Pseudonocardia sp.]|uniref:hypothetical protein n=1 Tax=Pseudonocardia sp. TaxID=60912 RepID=UPI003D0DAFF3
MTDRLHLAALWDGPACAGEDCTCPRCGAALDPRAAHVLAALDATRRDLAALAATRSLPRPDAAVPGSAQPDRGPSGTAQPDHGPSGTAPSGTGPFGTGGGPPLPDGPTMPDDLRARILSAADALRRAAGPTDPDDVPAARPVQAGERPATHALPPPAEAAPHTAGPAGDPPDTGHPPHRTLGRRTVLPGPRAHRGSPRAGRRARAALVAALGAAAVAGVLLGRPATGPSTAGSEPARHALAGTPHPGPLADPARQAACLVAVGVAPATALATRDVAVGDAPGVLLVLPTGAIGTYRLLVVDNGCTRVLADRTVGR